MLIHMKKQTHRGIYRRGGYLYGRGQHTGGSEGTHKTTYIWRDIHIRGTYTRGGYTHWEDIHTEWGYTYGDIYIKGYTYRETNKKKDIYTNRHIYSKDGFGLW